ncbi:MAG TPA: hypothetical protein VFV72_02505 [Candidatus Limnocylindrales bacterium]|nr:hypothetical protein [Candidatus Limnocylindrales bacterium]
MEAKAHDDHEVEPAESRTWDRVLRVFFATTPHRLLSAYSRRSSKSPIEQIVVIGRRTGTVRRHNVSVYDIDGAMYVGHPNGAAHWTRNLEAGGGVLVRRGSPPMRVRAIPLAPGPERSAVIAAGGEQPFPAGLLYRSARAHIEAVGTYYRLEPLEGQARAYFGPR